ncbi:MAG: DUF2846 domain-containing protein [Pseudomonadales bacterium]|nr:DUF2846 domain-containing protein [Pseudomonadales bacterium]
MKFNLIVIMILAVLTGCAAAPSGEQFTALKKPSENKSLVYIYRPNVYYGKAITYPVLLNKEKIADIGNRGYFTLNLDPGVYNIRPDTASIDHDLEVKLDAGKTKFLELYTNEKFALCFCTTLQFREVSEKVALGELNDTREEIERVYISQ